MKDIEPGGWVHWSELIQKLQRVHKWTNSELGHHLLPSVAGSTVSRWKGFMGTPGAQYREQLAILDALSEEVRDGV